MPAPDPPSLEVALRIEQVCNRFETAWKGEPRIEDFLDGWSGPGRLALLRELVLLDVEYRQQRGLTWSAGHYGARFSECDPGWFSDPVPVETAAPSAPRNGPPTDSFPAGKNGPTSAEGNRTPLHSFGDYEVLEEIARGAMGVVYRARQKSLNRLVALKVILAGPLASPGQVERFRAEAENAASLEHPYIVPIYEVGEHDRLPFFSMKLIEGGTLARHPAKDIPPLEAARLLAMVARAVHFAHQHGILHRDLKPSNILLDAQGQPHVTDFSLAKRVREGAGSTVSGAIAGTPSYMAPEQTEAKQPLSTAADVYGLGAVLYELLAGRPPFKAETPLDTMFQVMHNEPLPPSRVAPAVPRDLETICLKCLRKEPSRRYASAEALAEDLERFVNGEPVSARPVGRLERGWRWCRRNPALAAALASVLLVFAAGATVSTVFAIRESDARGKAESERTEAVKQKGIADDERTEAVKQKGIADDQRAVAENTARRLVATTFAYAAGRTVTLIPPTGPPAWYAWTRREPLDTASDATDKPFAVHGDSLALVELLPRCARRYRLRVEVHHESLQGEGTVGVYFGHSRKAAGAGSFVHGFCALNFNDIRTLPDQEMNHLRMSMHLAYPKPTDPGQLAIRKADAAVFTDFKPAGIRGPDHWRVLEVEASPERIKVTWDHTPLKDLARADLDKTARFLLENSRVRPDEDPRFETDEALGLFVFQGTAWFRSFTIEPLPDN
jgi:serine/threonine-protein kinase